MKTILSQNIIAVTIGTVIFSLALVISAFLVSNTDFYIRTLGGDQLASGETPNTISVDGQGRVYVKPDMVTFTVSASSTKPTSKEALNGVNEKISAVQKVLKEEGVDENDIQTASLNIYTEYDYKDSGRTVLGQTANQSLSVKIKNIDSDASKAASIIDKVANISNIEIYSITFDIEDKTEIFTKAREEAFKKAEQKAKELSSLGDVKLLKPIAISDSGVEYNAPVYQNTATFDKAESMASDSSLSTGKLEITTTVSVTFGIE